MSAIPMIVDMSSDIVYVLLLSFCAFGNVFLL